MIIAFANHKGGTGKTTSTAAIGKALTLAGKKVLVIDLDPQGNLSYSLGVDARQSTASFMTGTSAFAETVRETNSMHLLPANMSLYDEEKKLAEQLNPQYILKNKLSRISHLYDFILLDCPPSLSIYTANALHAANGVIIPFVFEILSIQGLDQILSEINKVRAAGNPGLITIGVLGVIVNESRKLSEEVLQYVRDNYRVNVFNNHVRANVKAAEAPSFAETVIDYAPRSASARDYLNVTNELLKITETIKEQQLHTL